MLTIENEFKLKGKVIPQVGYYVHTITAMNTINANTPIMNQWYLIELTNRHQFLMVQLEREGTDKFGKGELFYRLVCGQHYQYLPKETISDIDKLIDSIRLIILEQYVP